MITGDLDRALATAISSAGTWRPAPPGTACGPRTYATTIAFRLAGRDAGGPGAVAARLAARLRGLGWVEAVTVTGGGYLVATVTASALAGLAVRITQAGPGCARSSALAGTDLTGPAAVNLTSARTWEEARQRVHAAVTARLAEAAGARVEHQHNAERIAAPGSPVPMTVASQVTAPSVAAEAIAYAGADAITYALARLPPRGPALVDARLAATQHAGNPAYAVRYAHAHAASALRQAADLGLDQGEAAQFRPRLLAHPSEQALLYELSWLPDGRPGRRGAHGRTSLRTTWRAWPGRTSTARKHARQRGRAWPCRACHRGSGPPDRQAAARLWLAAAARTALGTGLGLLGVSAPDRL